MLASIHGSFGTPLHPSPAAGSHGGGSVPVASQQEGGREPDLVRRVPSLTKRDTQMTCPARFFDQTKGLWPYDFQETQHIEEYAHGNPEDILTGLCAEVGCYCTTEGELKCNGYNEDLELHTTFADHCKLQWCVCEKLPDDHDPNDQYVTKKGWEHMKTFPPPVELCTRHSECAPTTVCALAALHPSQASVMLGTTLLQIGLCILNNQKAIHTRDDVYFPPLQGSPLLGERYILADVRTLELSI
ncbi:MAG: hypothetical protein M1827_003637 [Pycnora praestabilis]|nr:MAG: hypothetical protein M1827_003637 [Pycnora praestabilis]